MIIPDPKRYTHSDENLLPMINIIFLLLIFFMIAGVIAASDELDLTLLSSQTGQETDLNEQALLLAANGHLIFGEVSTSLNAAPTELSGQLGQGYQLWRTRFPAAKDDTPLPVKMDANATSAQLATLMRALEAAKVQSIRIVAEAAE